VAKQGKAKTFWSCGVLESWSVKPEGAEQAAGGEARGCGKQELATPEKKPEEGKASCRRLSKRPWQAGASHLC